MGVLTHFYRNFANHAPGWRRLNASLAAIVPAFAIDRAGAADELPAFDIARNCREEVVAGPWTRHVHLMELSHPMSD